MTAYASNFQGYVECDLRESDGLTVRLLWHPHTRATAVEIRDNRMDIDAVFNVPTACALDAFRHPFAYAPNFAGVTQ